MSRIPTTPEELDAFIREEIRRDGGNPISLLLSIQDDLSVEYDRQIEEWQEEQRESINWRPPPPPLLVSARLTFELIALVEERVSAVERRLVEIPPPPLDLLRPKG